MRFPKLLPVSLLAAAWLLVGCGPPPNVTATGTVVQGGQPIKLGPTGVIQITLKPDVPADKEFTTIPGRCENGNFTIPNVPPGKYVIGIEILDPNPMSDKLNGKLTYNYSPIKREIDGKAPLTIDVAKPQ